MMSSYFLLSWTCSISAGTLDKVTLYTITGRNIAFLKSLLYVTCEAMRELVLNTANRQKGQSSDNWIILLFNSNCKRQLINLWFFSEG